MKNFIVIFLSILWLFGCSAKNFTKPSLLYTKSPLEFKQLMKSYEKVPLHRSKDIDQFVEFLPKVKDDYQIERLNFYGTVEYQVFIDEGGEIESIFLLKPLQAYLDEISLKALRQAKFKPLLSNGEPVSYSIIVTYLFADKKAQYPYVNGISTDPEKDPAAAGLSQVMVQPVILQKAVPIYYDDAKLAGAQGEVVVSVLIDEYGNVLDAAIRSSAHELLNESSLEAAMKYKFRPVVINGKAVKVRMDIPFEYELSSELLPK